MSYQKTKTFFLGLVILSFLSGLCAQETGISLKPYQFPVNGVVFEDTNANGLKDEDEDFLEDIPVSDGFSIVLTGDKGEFTFENKEKKIKNVFVCIPEKFKKTDKFYKTLINEKQGVEVEFALVPESGSEEKRYSFVQITDVHVNSEKDIKTLQANIEEVENIDEAPAFIVATGDLVGKGDERFRYYVDGISKRNIPIFNLPGNHDTLKGEDDIINYNYYLGPDYYSFNHGSIHFIFSNSTTEKPENDAWIKEDIEKLAGSKKIILFRHYQPSKERQEEFNELGIDTVVSGHWHSNKVYKYKDLQMINTPSFEIGPIDFSPGGFRVFKVNKSNYETDYRPNGVKEFIKIVYPSKGENIPYDRTIKMVVNAYDTLQKIDSMRAVLKCGEDQIVADLEKTSELTWTADIDLDDFYPGVCKITLTTDPKLTTEPQSFTITESVEELAAVKPAGIWPAFMGGPERQGAAKAELKTPLKAEWISSTGGYISFASPVTSVDTVFTSFTGRSEKEKSGIAAFDKLTGEEKWRIETTHPIHHSPVLFENLIIAQDMGGTVHAYDAEDGDEEWTYVCGDENERWIYGSPAEKNGKIFCGNAKWFAEIDGKTGKEIWHNTDGTDWVSCWLSPSVSDTYALTGGIWFKKNAKWSSLYGINVNNGVRKWALESTGHQAAASISGNRFFCNDIDGAFIIGNLETGEIIWKTEMQKKGNNWSSVTPAIKGNIAVSGTADGTICAFDIEKKSKMWEYKTGVSIFRSSPYMEEYKSALSSPTISGNIVYIGSGDGFLYGIDLKSGVVMWKFDFGVPVLSTPAVVDDALYVTASDGNLYKFKRE